MRDERREEQREEQIRQALDRALSFLETTPRQRAEIFAYATGGKKVKKRIRVSLGLALAIALMCLSVTALAVGAAIHQFFGQVAQMDAEGAFLRWNLEDKARFVETMRQYGFEMDENDYALLCDEARTEDEREAAADRIVDARYGALIQEQLDAWADSPAGSAGLAPDEMIIFKERYMASHPQGISTWEDLVEFTDALGYYLRDEYYPVLAQARENTPPPEINEAYAAQALRDYVTEVLSWSAEAAETLVPDVEWDGELGIWTATGEAGKDALEGSLEPVTEGPGIEKTETGCRFTLLVDSRGHFAAGMSKQAFHALHEKDAEPAVNLTNAQAEEIARGALQAKYALRDADMHRLFSDSEPAGIGEENGRLLRLIFHTHYQYDRENRYGAVVNMATGKVETVYSYLLEDLTPPWRLLDFAARTQREEGWYIHWGMDQKRNLAAAMKECGLLPESGFWRSANPTEAEIDAFAAEAFGARGYPSALNVTVMAHALLGPEQDWGLSTQGIWHDMAWKYNVVTADTTGALPAGTGEIGAAAAIDIIRGAVCRAWGEAEDALNRWRAEARLLQDSYMGRGLVYYRVFLTRPDTERDREGFDGADSFAYRVFLDGSIVDASVQPEWYSPAQDKALREEAALYDPALFRLFDRYAQENGLLFRYPDFFHWPIEDKYSCAEEIRPLIAEKDTNDPRLLAFLRHRWGLPEKGMIS